VGTKLHQWIYARHLNCYGFQPNTLPLPPPLPSGDPFPVLTTDINTLKNGAKFLQLIATSATTASLTAEIASAKASISAGQPALLGMVATGAATDGHVLVALGFDDSTPGTTALFVYDCNIPGKTCTLNVNPAALTCVEDIPGGLPDSFKSFFVMNYAAKVPTYIDLALSAGLTAALSPPDGLRAFQFHFSLKNEGETPAHAASLDLSIDEALPAGFTLPFEATAGTPIAPGATVRFSQSVNFPQELAGATLSVQPALTNSFGRIISAQIGTTGGVSNLQSITVPLEFD
jgi:hypothetical protein